MPWVASIDYLPHLENFLFFQINTCIRSSCTNRHLLYPARMTEPAKQPQLPTTVVKIIEDFITKVESDEKIGKEIADRMRKTLIEECLLDVNSIRAAINPDKSSSV